MTAAQAGRGQNLALTARIAAQPIRSLMQTDPLCVDGSESVAAVVEKMRERRASCALVCADEGLVGVFTERDYLDRIAGSPHFLARAIEEFMSPQPLSLAPEATLAELLGAVVRHGYRHLPVVDQKRPVGLVAAQDIVKYIADLFPTEVYNLPPRLDQVLPEVDGA